MLSPAMYTLDCGLGKVALLKSSERNCTTVSGVNDSPNAGIFHGGRDTGRRGGY